MQPLTVFDYTPTHQRDRPAAFLKDYRGYLQADAFNGYDGIYLESQGRIVKVACSAHAGGSSTSAGGWMPCGWRRRWRIGKLYAVERDLRERCQNEWNNLVIDERAERIAQQRQERSRPLLNSFRAWLEAEATKVLPKRPVRGAMDYTLNNWAALCVYSEDGWLDIDNNGRSEPMSGLIVDAQKTGLPPAVAAWRRAAIFPSCQGGTRGSFMPVVNSTAGYLVPSLTW